MRLLAIAAAAAAAVVLATAPARAEGALNLNGTSLNGMHLNGVADRGARPADVPGDAVGLGGLTVRAVTLPGDAGPRVVAPAADGGAAERR